jgi:hypothetical protein
VLLNMRATLDRIDEAGFVASRHKTHIRMSNQWR